MYFAEKVKFRPSDSKAVPNLLTSAGSKEILTNFLRSTNNEVNKSD